jgi:bifunctional DNA-binding transcriptional regulator/antitoxin component of YhaV-PrlF toxin-antitoxin module
MWWHLKSRLYNQMYKSYNDLMNAAEHLKTMSRNGQVSIPAQTRARWGTRKVIVVDLGDRVVMRPAPDEDPIDALQGKYADRGPDTAAARKMARRDESTAGKRRA